VLNWFDTVEFPQDGDGCRRDSTPHDPVTRVRFQGVGHVKANQHRAVVGRVKTVGVNREGRQWFAILSAEQQQPQPATGSVIGTDLGVANSLADSGGGFVPHPRNRHKAAAKLEAAQQTLSRFPRARRDKRTRWPPPGRAEGRQAARQGTPPATRPRTQHRAYAGP
jgi:putative transposase